MQPLLQQALALAPLDFGDVWGVGLRYALYNLSTSSTAGFKAVLQIVSRPVSAGRALVILSLRHISQACDMPEMCSQLRKYT